MFCPWPEVTLAKNENRYELCLSGPLITKRVKESGFDQLLFNLTTLNYLDIHDTCIQAIPESLGNLINLQTLVLHSNKLELLPQSIVKLQKLKVLDISNNLLKVLSPEIGNLSSLTSLNASSNKLETLPNFSQNLNLSILDLANNNLKEFPEICFPQLAHMYEIKLSKNSIEVIPIEINTLSTLKVFDLSENQIKIVPAELSQCNKIKEINLKQNPLSDKRLLKLVEQCKTKQIMDYINKFCPSSGSTDVSKSKKAAKKKSEEQAKNSNNQFDETVEILTHKLSVLHWNDKVPNIRLDEKVKIIRPHIVCCIVKDFTFDEKSFKRFIQLQTRLHDSICEKRNVATIATHDFDKIAPGDLTYTSKLPNELEIIPLMKTKQFTGLELFKQLKLEAEALRKEKKRNTYSGIHKYLHLLDGKATYPCLIDGKGQVISFPPITNSDITKMSPESTSMLIEVTSNGSQSICRKILDTLLQELVVRGIGKQLNKQDNEENPSLQKFILTVQQVKVVDFDGNLKSVYPSRSDLVYENNLINIIRE